MNPRVKGVQDVRSMHAVNAPFAEKRMVPCRGEIVVKKILCLVALLAALPLHAQESRAPINVSALGPQVGEQVPDFSLPDQHGAVQTLDFDHGPKGRHAPDDGHALRDTGGRHTPRRPIDPAYVERPRATSHPMGLWQVEAFAVVREAMDGRADIGKLALHGREHLIAVQPRDRGLIMYTLRHARELRRMDAIDELEHVPTDVNRDEVALAQQVMQSFEGNLDLSEFRD